MRINRKRVNMSHREWHNVSRAARIKQSKQKALKRTQMRWESYKVRIKSDGKPHLTAMLANKDHKFTKKVIKSERKLPWIALKTINKLRTGHNALGGQQKYQRDNQSSVCDTCNVKETTEHIIFTCAKHIIDRSLMEDELKEMDLNLQTLNLYDILHPFPKDLEKRNEALQIIANYIMRTGIVL
eukprot:19337_1